MTDVDVDVVLVRTSAATFQHFAHHRAGDDVAGSQVDDRRCVALHEALAFAVEQPTALAAHRFGDQDAQASQAGRMELVKFHVLQRKSFAEHDPDTVAGQRVRVGRGLVHPARAAGGDDGGFGVEDMDLAGGQFVSDHPGGHGPFGVSVSARSSA